MTLPFISCLVTQSVLVMILVAGLAPARPMGYYVLSRAAILNFLRGARNISSSFKNVVYINTHLVKSFGQGVP